MEAEINRPSDTLNGFVENGASKPTSYSMYKNNAVKKKNTKHNDSLSNSDSMKVEDSSVEKGQIPRTMIVGDMMDKSHNRGPMHLVFDLV